MKALMPFLLIVGLVGCEGGAGSLDQAEQLKAEAEAEIKKGNHALIEVNGDLDAAILHFTEAIKIAKQMQGMPGASSRILGRAYADLGTCYLGKGDHDKALAEYNKAIRIFDVTKQYDWLGSTHGHRKTIYGLKARKASTAEERARFEALADQEDSEARVNRMLNQERTRRRQSQ